MTSEQGAVEASLLVLEDAEARDLPGELVCLIDAVAPSDAEQDAEAPANLPHHITVDRRARRRDALDDGSHL